MRHGAPLCGLGAINMKCRAELWPARARRGHRRVDAQSRCGCRCASQGVAARRRAQNMALTELQRHICQLLAEARRKSGESYVAGGVALSFVEAVVCGSTLPVLG